MSVAGLLLAAGAGTRFGRPKALVTYDGQLLVEHGTALLRAAGCQPVLTVLGAAADEVRRSADLSGVLVVVNVDWATGMGSSLVAGLRALPAEADAVVVALADQPLVGPVAVSRLAAAWQGGAVAAVATYDGSPRNPVLLDRAIWSEVAAAAAGDAGARGWLRSHSERVTAVPCDGTGSPYDLDTPEDLETLLSMQEEIR